MTAAAQGAYGQLLGLGLLWISFHCAGMCGTLLINLDVPGRAEGHGALRGAAAILGYQAGRALTYAWLGGLAGLLGAGLGQRFAGAGAVVALGLGAGAVLLGVRGLRAALRPPAPRLVTLPAGRGAPAPGLVARALARAGTLAATAGAAGPLRPVVLGAILGLLPCMIAAWALGLAALTGSPLHGAAIMLLLVVMTTPTLLGVTLLPRLVPLPAALRRRLGAWAPPLLLVASGAHMLLIGAAAAGALPHAHLGLRLLGRGVMVMFY